MDKIRAVICEDEARIRRGIERLISGFQGWEVIGTFSDGALLLEAMEDQPLELDVLVTDVKMPNVGGVELIKKLNQTHSVFSVIISGYEDFEIVQEALREGASDYILKPINRKKLETRFHIIREKVSASRKTNQQSAQNAQETKDLTYTKQVQLLNEMMLKSEMETADLEWTELFPAGKFVLLNASVDNLSFNKNIFTDSDWKTWIFAIENIIGETSQQFSNEKHKNCWWWRGEKSSYWFLLWFPEEEKDQFDLTAGFAEVLQRNLQSYTPLTFSIAFEHYFNELALLPSMREKILSLMQLRIIRGSNRIYHPALLTEIHNESKNDTSKNIYLEIQKIVVSIEKLELETVEKKLNILFNELKKLASPEAVQKSIRFYLFRVIVYLFKDDNRGYEFLYPIFLKLKNTSDFEQLKSDIISWTKDVINEKQSVDFHLNQIDKAKYWIQQNIADSITISKIAEEVYMNPTYFCEVFKKQTGETVLDYVTRVRIEKAKELLTQTNLKIQEISEHVGYKDAKYFSKLFHQYTGELPSKYRNIYHIK
ncbi:response regulator transcription factor [Alkalicoccus daliensis]|uniref:Two-component system, response regulator YesN n=1 Tax=Alkalicoccus daliensis TaxID=745820 RepID=A0A1H0E7X2_9BACI|nr:helix-turn-helix domain-containing protein [Alkalicoccus daliensis]SDN78475.1 two-component system, response regulator YesN [Alkalicoccus daliensis]